MGARSLADLVRMADRLGVGVARPVSDEGERACPDRDRFTLAHAVNPTHPPSFHQLRLRASHRAKPLAASPVPGAQFADAVRSPERAAAIAVWDVPSRPARTPRSRRRFSARSWSFERRFGFQRRFIESDSTRDSSPIRGATATRLYWVKAGAPALGAASRGNDLAHGARGAGAELGGLRWKRNSTHRFRPNMGIAGTRTRSAG
jgi:hypothetical protein